MFELAIEQSVERKNFRTGALYIVQNKYIVFLVPLRILKILYQKILNVCDVRTRKEVFYTKDVILLLGSDKIGLNTTAKWQGFSLTLWLCGAILLCVVFLLFYLKGKRKILKNQTKAMLQKEKFVVQQLKETYKIRASVVLVSCPNRISPFTMGIRKAVIVLPEYISEKEKLMVLEHEMTHIKQKDMLWRFLGIVVIILHWFNPFAWLTFRRLKQVCEYACDERITIGKDNAYVSEYAELLVKTATLKSGKNAEIALSEQAREIEKRIQKMFRKSVTRKCL